MNIVILGAGQVGSTLAENLVNEDNDITVIDKDANKLQKLQERLDIRTIWGNAAYPKTLKKAGAEEADMIIAVTNSDETNMVACQVAFTLFQTPTKVARIRSREYQKYPQLFDAKAMPIDVLISPETIVTTYIKSLVERPDALQVLNFANNKLQLISVKASKEGDLVGFPLKDISRIIPDTDVRIVAIFRDETPIIPQGSTTIKEGDIVFFLAAIKDVRDVIASLRSPDNFNRNIIIAGGGNIGTALAESLEDDLNVKIIDHNPKHAEYLASHLDNAVVLLGDCADKELLINENIEQTDVFCAVTNYDEANIMSALLAKRLGAKTVMALVNRQSYVDIMNYEDIDIAISPQQTTIGSILTHLRRGDIVNVYSLRQGAAEAIEAIAHGDQDSSLVVGKSISQLDLPKGATIAAVVKGDKILMGHHDVIIEDKDHIIIFLIDKSKINEIERLFQSTLSYY